MSAGRRLKQRVVLAVTATVALLVGLQTGLAWLAMHEQEDELIDEQLQHEVQDLVRRLAGMPAPLPGLLQATHKLRAWVTRGSAGADALPVQARRLQPGAYQLAPDGRVWHVAVVDTAGGRLTVVLDATDSEQRVTEFGLTLLALWLLCVVATVGIARGVAAIAIAPMAAATQLVAGWSPAAQGAAVAPGDEAALLIETFNRFRDGMDASIAREREFAANVDHELRTPLTAIRTDAELLPLDAALSPGQRDRARRIAATVDDIIATLAATRRASAGAPAPTEAVALFDCVQSVCESIAERARVQGLAIRNDIARGATVVADRQALLTIVRNLVRNAIEHAAPATLVIAGDAAGLVFDDDGGGIPAGDLQRVFERYHEGRRSDAAAGGPAPPRRGLGLAIARRLCDLQGWSLTATSPRADGRPGTRFALRFGR